MSNKIGFTAKNEETDPTTGETVTDEIEYINPKLYRLILLEKFLQAVEDILNDNELTDEYE